MQRLTNGLIYLDSLQNKNNPTLKVSRVFLFYTKFFHYIIESRFYFNIFVSATSAMQSAQSALTKCGQLESGKMSNSIVNCLTSPMSTLSETRSYALKVNDPNMFVYVEGIPNTDSGYLCCSIPMDSIPKTTQAGTVGGRRYQLTDEVNYFSFTLAFNDITATLYITFSTRAKAGAAITKVALYG